MKPVAGEVCLLNVSVENILGLTLFLFFLVTFYLFVVIQHSVLRNINIKRHYADPKRGYCCANVMAKGCSNIGMNIFLLLSLDHRIFFLMKVNYMPM